MNAQEQERAQNYFSPQPQRQAEKLLRSSVSFNDELKRLRVILEQRGFVSAGK